RIAWPGIAVRAATFSPPAPHYDLGQVSFSASVSSLTPSIQSTRSLLPPATFQIRTVADPGVFALMPLGTCTKSDRSALGRTRHRASSVPLSVLVMKFTRARHCHRPPLTRPLHSPRLGCGSGPSLHDDPGHHVRVQRAVVSVGAGCGETVRELLPIVQPDG